MSLPEEARKTICSITTKEEYDNLKWIYESSSAPEEIKDEAIRVLKATHPNFDDTKKEASQVAYDQIREGLADTSDIGGMN